MRVGWLADQAPYVGGAELSQAEFRAAAPAGVEIVDCLPGQVADCDRYVIHNCLTYGVTDLEQIAGAPVVKYWHDVGPHVHPTVHAWFAEHATQVCCSPVQAEHMGITGPCVPPAINYEAFYAAADASEDRGGAVSIGAWQNPGKAPHAAGEWAGRQGVGIDFFGGGPCAPSGSQLVAPDAVPGILARYRTFVFLPTAMEPFGRVVAEAWAAGCEVVTNKLVGARWWIENDPDALTTAAEDFWKVAAGELVA